jgi:hypothetical protein
MIGEEALLELVQDAVRQDFFSEKFLTRLQKVVDDKLGYTDRGIQTDEKSTLD